MASNITEESVELKIKENVIGVQFIKVTDLSDGCGAKFEIEVVANAFEGKSLLEQHRSVPSKIVIQYLTNKTDQLYSYQNDSQGNRGRAKNHTCINLENKSAIKGLIYSHITITLTQQLETNN